MDLLPAGLDTWPVHAADAELLADLELLLAGARLDLGGQLRPLPDGRVALRAQPDVAGAVADAGHVVLADPEGTPLAVLAVEALLPSPGPAGTAGTGGGRQHDGGPVDAAGEWVGVLRALRAPA
ncbi:MAG: hypothetical protein ACJ786_27955, partial [Catenulispora sp.]